MNFIWKYIHFSKQCKSEAELVLWVRFILSELHFAHKTMLRDP